MTVFKDRLAASIKLQRTFAASPVRVRTARNRALGIVILVLALSLLAVLFHWMGP